MTVLKVVCGWCHKLIGVKEGCGITHSICSECEAKHFPDSVSL